jgi:hypothetical protein
MAIVGTQLRVGGLKVEPDLKPQVRIEDLVAKPNGRTADLAARSLVAELTGSPEGRSYHEAVLAKLSELHARGDMAPGMELKIIRNFAHDRQISMTPEEEDIYLRICKSQRGPAGAAHLAPPVPAAAPELPSAEAVASACRAMTVSSVDSNRPQVEGYKIALASAMALASGNIVKARDTYGVASPEYRQAWAAYQDVRARLNVTAYDHYLTSYNQSRELLSDPSALQAFARKQAANGGMDLSDPKVVEAVDRTFAPDIKRRCEVVVRQYESLGFAKGGEYAINPDTGKPEALLMGWQEGKEGRVQLSELGLKEAGVEPSRIELDKPLAAAPAPTRPVDAIEGEIVPSREDVEPSPEVIHKFGLMKVASGAMATRREATYHLHNASPMAHGARAVTDLHEAAASLKWLKAMKFLGQGTKSALGAIAITGLKATEHILNERTADNPFGIIAVMAKTPIETFRSPGTKQRFERIERECREESMRRAQLAHEAGVIPSQDYIRKIGEIAKTMQKELPGGYTPQQLHGFEVSTRYLVNDSISSFDAAMRRAGVSPEDISAMPRQEALERIRKVGEDEIRFLAGNGLDPDGTGRAAIERGALLYYGYAKDLGSEENTRLRLIDLRVRMEASGIANQNGSLAGGGHDVAAGYVPVGLSAMFCSAGDQLQRDIERVSAMPAGPEREAAFRDLWNAVRDGKGFGLQDRSRIKAMADSVNAEFLDGYSSKKSIDIISTVADPRAAKSPDDMALAGRPDVRTTLETTAIGLTGKSIETLAINPNFIGAFRAKWGYERELAKSFATVAELAPTHAASLCARGLDPASVSTMIDTGETIGGNAAMRNVGAMRNYAKDGLLELPKGMSMADLDAGNPIGYAKLGEDLDVGVMVGYRQPQGRIAEEAKLHFTMPPGSNAAHNFRVTVTLSAEDLSKSSGDLRRIVVSRLRNGGYRGAIDDDAVLKVMSEVKTMSNEGGRRTLVERPNARLKFPSATEMVKPSLQEALSNGFKSAMNDVGEKYVAAFTHNGQNTMRPMRRNSALNDLIRDYTDGNDLYGKPFSRDWQSGRMAGMSEVHRGFQGMKSETGEGAA